ncbi:hypothetical protein UWK_02454 [Desulfocapsa sulfexigens DSM 10523]|uniref:Uncharacterized protein n=1 Tax=Desulfocapsa sulfexigens (strain DSM 10523 / SB164P1) TaxID=1167006 RepID=M1PRM9_DESSD|nr:hypothetical protein [Desulfocapsa sulfexigens]AGF78991.1 hypothetical protein UWK_02454 [Desulfocapsa sulfexigens DSM 10523]
MSKDKSSSKIISFFNEKKLFVIQKCFCFTVDYGFPRASAIILALLTKNINVKKGAKRIFCIGSLASLYDINALIKKSHSHQYLYLPRFNFGYILRKFVDVSDLNADNYYVDKKYVDGREKAYNYISLMLPVLRGILKFDCLMTSNFGYVEQQEFVRITRELGIPVVILYKEGLVNPRFVDKISRRYSTRKTQCDLFLCYNETIKEALIKSNVDGLTDENVRATGVPRLDFYSNEKTSEALNQITLFSFKAEDKFSNIVEDEKTMAQLRKTIEDFHMYVIQYACEHPDSKVVIKTKLSKRNLNFVNEIVRKYTGKCAPPANLIVTDTGDAFAYIVESSCVLGCNSTVLLEALLAGKTVVSPDFRFFFSHPSWSLFEGYEQLLTYVASYSDFVQLVGKSRQYTQDEEKALSDLFKQYIYSADGKSSIRVEESISQLLQ